MTNPKNVIFPNIFCSHCKRIFKSTTVIIDTYKNPTSLHHRSKILWFLTETNSFRYAATLLGPYMHAQKHYMHAFQFNSYLFSFWKNTISFLKTVNHIVHQMNVLSMSPILSPICSHLCSVRMYNSTNNALLRCIAMDLKFRENTVAV